MMDISELSEQQKSVLLARVSGQEIEYDPLELTVLSQVMESGEIIAGLVPDLYNPVNMALALRVLNWALQNESITAIEDVFWSDNEPSSVLSEFVRWQLWEADTIARGQQRAWLDKVLVLCIEAGLVEADEAGE